MMKATMETRRCTVCHSPDMAITGSQTGAFSRTATYTCPTCGTSVKLESERQAGRHLLTWILAASAVSALIIGDTWGIDLIDGLILVAIWFGGGYVMIGEIVRQRRHPVTGAKEIDCDEGCAIATGIAIMQDKGYAGGALTLLIVMAVVLGLAAAFGFVNDVLLADL